MLTHYTTSFCHIFSNFSPYQWRICILLKTLCPQKAQAVSSSSDQSSISPPHFGQAMDSGPAMFIVAQGLVFFSFRLCFTCLPPSFLCKPLHPADAPFLEF